jgi:hypothetical protein
MSGKGPKKTAVQKAGTRPKSATIPKSTSPGPMRLGTQKYGVPVLKNLALAGGILTCGFFFASQRDRITLFTQKISPSRTETESLSSFLLAGLSGP